MGLETARDKVSILLKDQHDWERVSRRICKNKYGKSGNKNFRKNYSEKEIP